MRIVPHSIRLPDAESLPDIESLVAELETFRLKVAASVNETFGTWRERDHDDLVLATALAAWAGELALPNEGPVEGCRGCSRSEVKLCCYSR